MSVYFGFASYFCHLWGKLPERNLSETNKQKDLFFRSVLWLGRHDSWGSFCGRSLTRSLFPLQGIQKQGELGPGASFPTPSPATHFLLVGPHPKVYATYNDNHQLGSI